MDWFSKLITAVLKWLTAEAKTDVTSINATPDPELRKDLNDRINASDPRLRD
jgi:hypothetical protein